MPAGEVEGETMLDQQDIDTIKENCRTVIKEEMPAIMRLHQAECPVKAEVEELVNKAKGARWVFGLIAGLVVFVVDRALTYFGKG
jgi:hypothetical protein